MSSNDSVLHHNILVVDDEEDLLELVRYTLVKEGHSVTCVDTGEKAVDLVRQSLPDLIVLDLMLPGIDGLEVCRRLKGDLKTREVPIIMLTAKSEERDVITGLDGGADDYVTKPFDPRELLSRVKNLVWRVRTQEKQKEKGFKRHFEGWTLDLNKRELTTPQGQVQSLSAGEFHLLLALIENAGEVMTRDQLMNKIRNREWYPDDRYIDVLVGQVRRKFRQFDAETTFISTIHGTGYLFAPTVN